MIRLFFREGPFDGGQADFDTQPPKSRKGRERGETLLPDVAFVAIDGAGYAWRYRLFRAITAFSGEYVLAGWVNLNDVNKFPIVLIGP